MMFEIGIFCVIVFAVGYWTTLFIMGRREDVLHGEFVEGEPELVPAPEAAPMPFPGAKPVLRASSVAEHEPAPAPVVTAEVVAQALPIVAAPARAPDPVVVPPAPQPAVARAPANNERLQSLLVSIKQELKNAAQI
jgi:hypothetical protein